MVRVSLHAFQLHHLCRIPGSQGMDYVRYFRSGYYSGASLLCTYVVVAIFTSRLLFGAFTIYIYIYILCINVVTFLHAVYFTVPSLLCTDVIVAFFTSCILFGAFPVVR